MPLDHYVPQVYLKNFYSPKLGNLLYAIRKSDLKLFTPNAQSVCRIEDGSSTPYLRDHRVVEEFLKGIEPKYNVALEKLVVDNIDTECIYVIAGFVAYVALCSPAGMRMGAELLRATLEEYGRLLDSKGVFSKPPPALGGTSFTELLNSGKSFVEIDHKYPQAIGIALILSHAVTLGNFEWDILINPFEDSPFFTSDFPVAIEKTESLPFPNKIVPLLPNLAIRIRPNPSLDRDRADFSFASFRHTVKKLNRAAVVNINRLIVRCAENAVFFRDSFEWIPNFVKRNALFRMESQTQIIPHERGKLLRSTHEIVKIPRHN